MPERIASGVRGHRPSAERRGSFPFRPRLARARSTAPTWSEPGTCARCRSASDRRRRACERVGETFSVEFLSQHPADARIPLPYFRDLERLGIDADLHVVEASQYVNLLRRFEFDAIRKNQDILMPPVIELKST